ncbi:GSTO1 [Symbiodinium natans]|uniref:GSTO1 protein n=1 Tax=Symbiodinium natans TaxID=878477 RepID=A0A812THD8_9DINO|nr:GSTO1 [Symbiodinium natans]
MGIGYLLQNADVASAHIPEQGVWPSVRHWQQRSSFEAGAPSPKTGLKQVEKVSQNVGCAPGFRCMSKISEFGMEHNGEYKRVYTPILPPRFEQRDVWEWGCPARGDMTPAGKCQPPKPGEEGQAGMCWSQNAMLAGPKTPCGSSGDKCMCVKPATSDGAIGYGNKSKEILPEFTEGDSGDAGGVEVVMGNFQVQPLPHCDDCLGLSSNWEQCSECANCSYGTKVLDGRPTLACYDKDFQPPGQPVEAETPPKAGEEYRKRNFVLLQGKRAEEQDLWIIPQYPLWDPEPEGLGDDASGGQVFPFQINAEPLSNEAWVKAYKVAAPKIQQLGPSFCRMFDIVSMGQQCSVAMSP